MNIRIENLTEDNLKKIEAIDNTFYTNAITDFTWYTERYKSYHKAIFLYNDDNICVGYLASFPIQKVLYDALLNGVIVNDLYINPSMFLEYSDYYYIYSCVILDDYKYKGYGKQMFSKLLTENCGKYVALTISVKGFNLAKKFMNHKIKIDDTTHIFEKISTVV